MTRAAMLLCAGLGTRLRPLTDWLAKPMVPIGDRPAVAHVAAHVRAAGIARIAVNVHHRPEDLVAWARATDAGVSEEPELLGTAGGIAKAASLLGDGDVLVWNGDILAEPDLGALFQTHEDRAAAATLAVVPRARNEGNVGIARDGRIVRLRKQAFPALGEEVAGADFTGIHVVGAGLRSDLPREGCIVGDVYLPALARGAHLEAHVVAASFTDVGSLSAYVAANRAWLGDRREWAAPDARVEARIDGSIIGGGAVIAHPVTNSIVWPGTLVSGPIDNAIVTRHGTIELST